MSTSVAYLRKRLADIGRYDLLDAADRGLVSVYACAEEAGLVTRPEVQGNGSPNAAKRRAWSLMRVTGKSPLTAKPEAEFSQSAHPKFSQERNGRPSGSSTPVDLVAALAEWEEAQRPAPPRDGDLELERELVRERKPAPATLPPEPAFPVAHPAVPCASCERPEAAAALREVLASYVAGRRGEPQTGNVLPRSCCRWVLHQQPDPKALIA